MDEDIDEQAARWHVTQECDDMDWDGFTAWLEADPRHRLAFDSIALLDNRIERSRDLLRRLTVPDEETAAPSGRHRWLAWGSAAAAVAVAVIGVVAIQRPTGNAVSTYVDYRAPAAVGRSVQLADGSTIAIDPGSLVRVASTRGAPIVLEGRAVFTIRHDTATPVVVRAGPYEIRDVGTVFEVSSTADVVRVTVSEGEVAVAAVGGGRETRVAAGQALTALGRTRDWQLTPLGRSSVVPWRPGPLVYDDAPLMLVAGDIARRTGSALTVDTDIAGRRFSGAIAPGSRDAMARSLAQLTGLQVRKDGDAARLASGASR